MMKFIWNVNAMGTGNFMCVKSTHENCTRLFGYYEARFPLILTRKSSSFMHEACVEYDGVSRATMSMNEQKRNMPKKHLLS